MPELAFIILVTYLSNLYNFSSIYFSSHKILPLYFFFFLHSEKKSLVEGDSDDDGQPNTYDYQDSFIDDKGLSGMLFF